MRPAGALAVATFASLQKASQACQRLDGATFKGSKLACRLEAHVDRSHDQRGRLVVRNLHFRALEEDLLDAFMAYGPLREARVPRVGEKSRGFGFVEFFCEKDARSALKAASSGEFKVKGRPVAVDQATPKSDHVVAAPEPAQASEDGASASGDEESEASEASDAADETKTRVTRRRTPPRRTTTTRNRTTRRPRKTRSRTTSPRAGRCSSGTCPTAPRARPWPSSSRGAARSKASTSSRTRPRAWGKARASCGIRRRTARRTRRWRRGPSTRGP